MKVRVLAYAGDKAILDCGHQRPRPVGRKTEPHKLDCPDCAYAALRREETKA